MKDINYGFQRVVSLPFKAVDQKIRDALQNVGFGIITEIDLKKTFGIGVDPQKIKN